MGSALPPICLPAFHLRKEKVEAGSWDFPVFLAPGSSSIPGASAWSKSGSWEEASAFVQDELRVG